MTSALTVGATAPDFVLRDQHGSDVSLSSYAGAKNVLLVFYPWAFSGICTGELVSIRDDLGRFVRDDLQVLTISCDSIFALRAYADRDGYFFPMLSDFWPHGAVARAYRVFDEAAGAAVRGTFLIDRGGVLRWTLVNGIGQSRDLTGFEDALASA